MNILAGILSLIFLILSILVIRRSGMLAKSLSNSATDEGYASVTSGNKGNAIGFVLFFIIGCVLGVWSFIDSMPQMFQKPNSIHGVGTDNMFWISMSIITLNVFAVAVLSIDLAGAEIISAYRVTL